jgi:hypothetical protein
VCFWIAVEDGTLMLKKRWKSMPVYADGKYIVTVVPPPGLLSTVT